MNGPGLRWAQSQILSHLGYDDEGDSVATSSTASGSGAGHDALPSSEFPARPIPPLVIDHPAAASSKSSAAPAASPASGSQGDSSGALPGLPPVPETPVQPHDAATVAVTPAPPPAPLETSRERRARRGGTRRRDGRRRVANPCAGT